MKNLNVNSQTVINKLLEKISNLEYQLALVTVALEEATTKDDIQVEEQ